MIYLLFKPGPANKLGSVCVGSNITLLIVGISSKPVPSMKNSRPPDIETIDKTPFAVSFLCLRPSSGSATDSKNGAKLNNRTNRIRIELLTFIFGAGEAHECCHEN